MPLSRDAAARLQAFHKAADFAHRGGVITDLDGTAVHEREGRVRVALEVEEGLKSLADLGRPVVLNTLRFPLNVVKTFGRAWSAITAQPIPLVALNGSMFGLLTPVGETDTTFQEIEADPLSGAELGQVAQDLTAMVEAGVEDLLVFHYPRDWRRGEVIWTPRPDREAAVREKYQSASEVVSGPVAGFCEALVAEGACMLSILADIPQDRRMAYQHASPSRFVTGQGVDKLSGARKAAARLGFDLGCSVGAGDTPMDNFLEGVGLALQVGPMALDFRGRVDTLRLTDPAELGTALFGLAQLQLQDVAA